MIKLKDLYVDRVLGLQKLSDSVYCDIAKDALQHPDEDVQSWEHFNDYVKHSHRCWGVPIGITIERLRYYTENLVKKQSMRSIMLYMVDNKVHIIEGHHRLGLQLAKNENAEIAYPDVLLNRPWVIDLDEPRNLEKLELCAKKIYGFEKLYHRIPVSGFSGWQYERPYDNRVNTIKEQCDSSDIRFLDLGCDTGWLDFAMHSSERFFVGVDNNPHAIETANRLSFILDKPVYFIKSDILDFLEDRGQYGYALHFDVTFFLSVFQHIYRENPDKAAKILNLISEASNGMFFDSIEADDNTSSAFPPDLKEKFTMEFLRKFVFDNTDFTAYRLLRRDNFLRRHLFYFYREDDDESH